MSISFVGGAENSAINGGDVTLTLPSMLQDDIVIVVGAIGDNDNVDFTMGMITAGYTKVADLFANDTQDSSLGVFWKFMGATPDATAVFDGQGAADASCAAVCMVFRGVDLTTPMDVTPTTATAIDTMHPNPPSIDHLNPAGLWTVICGASGHTLAGAGTYTFPTGYTVDSRDVGADDTGGDCTVGMGYRTNPADPEDPGVMTHSGTDNVAFAWCAATLALRPAAEPAPVVEGVALAPGIASWALVAQHLAHGRAAPYALAEQSLRAQVLHNAIIRDFGLATQSLRTSAVHGGQAAAVALATWALQAQHFAQARVQDFGVALQSLRTYVLHNSTVNNAGVAAQSMMTSVVHGGRVAMHGMAEWSLRSSRTLLGVASGQSLTLWDTRASREVRGIVSGISAAVTAAIGFVPTGGGAIITAIVRAFVEARWSVVFGRAMGDVPGGTVAVRTESKVSVDTRTDTGSGGKLKV